MVGFSRNWKNLTAIELISMEISRLLSRPFQGERRVYFYELKVDPFDWTKDKAIYQRWQMWSEKARHTLDAMEGDSEKTKISYFHHWIDGEGMGKIESWKNKKILISQEEYNRLDEKEGKFSSEKIESYFILFESLLAQGQIHYWL